MSITQGLRETDIVIWMDDPHYCIEYQAVKAGTSVTLGDVVEDETGVIEWDGTGTVTGIALEASVAAVPASIKVLVRGPAIVNRNNLTGTAADWEAGLNTLGIVAR